MQIHAFFSKKGLVFFLTWVYDKCVNYIRQYLQGRVKFPIGGIVRERSDAQDLA